MIYLILRSQLDHAPVREKVAMSYTVKIDRDFAGKDSPEMQHKLVISLTITYTYIQSRFPITRESEHGFKL